MEVMNTEGNRELAAAVNARMAADSRIVNAKAAMHRLYGISALTLALGAGVGLAALGIARIYDKSTSADVIAVALSTALKDVTLKTEGEVRLDPKAVVGMADDAVVGMAPNSTVALAPGGIVSLDPKSKIGISGAPSSGSEASIRERQQEFQKGGSKVVSNFTRFHSVEWNGATIMTGWEYGSSEDDAPRSQFCYTMVKNGDGNAIRIDLGWNGVTVPTRSVYVNVPAAAEKCFWTASASTTSPARTKAY
jgi:hypothetical protein